MKILILKPEVSIALSLNNFVGFKVKFNRFTLREKYIAKKITVTMLLDHTQNIYYDKKAVHNS